MDKLSQMVKRVCLLEGIKLSPIPKFSTFKYELKLTEDICFLGAIEIEEETGKISVNTYFPFKIDKPDRAKIAELFIRINDDMFIGSFNMNFDDGIAYCKTSAFFDSNYANDELFKHIFIANRIYIRQYCFIVIGVVMSKMTLKRAINWLNCIALVDDR